MPSPVVKGVIAAISIALGSCAGLFAIPAPNETCQQAVDHEAECAGVGPATAFVGLECDGDSDCVARCSLAASCAELLDFSSGLPGDLQDCVFTCLGEL